MTIGTSHGMAFEDDFQHSAGVEIPPDTKDNNVIDPGTTPNIGTRDNNEAPTKRDGTVGPAKVLQVSDPVKDVIDRVSQDPGAQNIKRIFDRPNFDADIDAVKGFYNSIKDAVTLPGDVLMGNVPPGSSQELERTLNLATLLVTGPAPVAARMADGTLGSFMGVRAKTFDRRRMYDAHNAEMEGVHPDDIWKNSQTFRGADGQWRQEITDKGASLKDSAFDKTVYQTSDGSEAPVSYSLKQPKKDFFGKSPTVLLKDIFDHPDLEAAYPGILNVKVEPLPDTLVKANIKGDFNESNNTLRLAPDLEPEYMKGVILHELGHKIQGIEGFSRGANKLDFIDPEVLKSERSFVPMKESVEGNIASTLGSQKDVNNIKSLIRAKKQGTLNPEDTRLKDFESKYPQEAHQLDNIVKGEDLLNQHYKEAWDKYWKSRGEVEARNVQARDLLERYQQILINPSKTESIPRELQLDTGKKTGTTSSEGTQLNTGGAGIKYNMLSDIYNKITGNTSITESKADNLSSYPSQEDAKEAIQAGFGYGTGNEPYVEAKQANIKTSGLIGNPTEMINSPSKNVDLTKLSNIGDRAKLATMYAQGALAVNRSAIATLGFDPTKIDVSTNLGKTTIAGAYSPTSDKTWVNSKDAIDSGSIVHESIHRGIERLRKESPEAKELLKKLPSEESVVRYMMAKVMGNPEEGKGSVSDEQRKTALSIFNLDSSYSKNLERLEEIAANLHKNQRPRGPR